MDRKWYHKHTFKSRDFSETYFSDKPDMVFGDDTLKFPMKCFHYVVSSGFLKGGILIDISLGAFIHHLHSACGVFKDIVILKHNEQCNMETSKWANARTGAYNWKHTSAHAAKLEGKSGQIDDKEEQLKTAISHIISCDFENENITHPVVLPLADCVISLWILDVISKHEHDYMRNLEKMSKLIKPGGHLILVSALNISFFMVETDCMHCFKSDESFVKNALHKLGFVIHYCAVQKRTNTSKITDYEAFMFIMACKGK